MNITGHGKGYAYDMGSETDIAVFFGVVELLLWLLAILPVTVSLCKKMLPQKEVLGMVAVSGLYRTVCVGNLCFGVE